MNNQDTSISLPDPKEPVPKEPPPKEPTPKEPTPKPETPLYGEATKSDNRDGLEKRKSK
jgi:hypothetical protein